MKIRNAILVILTIVIMVLMLLLKAARADGSGGYLEFQKKPQYGTPIQVMYTTAQVKVRPYPTKEHKEIASFRKGTEVLVYDIVEGLDGTGNWAYIKDFNLKGYIHMEVLSFDKNSFFRKAEPSTIRLVPEDRELMVVSSDRKVNLRVKPTTQSNRVIYLRNGNWVEVIKTTINNLGNEWGYVYYYPEDKFGWVMMKYLEAPK